MTITVAKIGNRIVQIVSVADRVGFSTDRGWVMICTDWHKTERLKSEFRWVSADTRFEWVREYIA